jgi:EAL domain-containing protein (putative c-di-GMP-specific phosphodiesterase class I)/GGDEF domain-containing protein
MTDLKTERDRYVAMAFTAADILMELGHDRRVKTVAGACQSLLGRPTNTIQGIDIGDIAAQPDRAYLLRLLDTLNKTGRLDPVEIRLAHTSGATPDVLLGASYLPAFPGQIFLTLTAMPVRAAADAAHDAETGLLTHDSMIRRAQRVATGGESGQSPLLSLIKLDGLEEASLSIPGPRRDALLHEIGAVMRAASVDGQSAGRLGSEEFGIVRTSRSNLDHLSGQVEEVAKDAGLPPTSITTRIATVDLTLGDLNDAEAARAIAYAVKSFSEGHGEDFGVASLGQGLAAAMDRTVARFSSLNQLIKNEDLRLVYQPIVALKSLEIHHYEVLSRFAGTQSPLDTITFSEEVGLIEELDLAVCRKALADLDRTHGIVLAVNISGRSVGSDSFRHALSDMLSEHRNVANRLIFELTESSAVERVDEASSFLRTLREKGHRICLDDFGAGAAAYSYLRHFDVDFVKIDGPLLRAAGARPREFALVHSICRLCADLNCATIGEMIETQKEAATAVSLGISFGQGWLYGRPANDLPPLSLKPVAAKPAAKPAAKRPSPPPANGGRVVMKTKLFR